MNLRNYKIKGSTKCDCGYEFTLKDFQELRRIKEEGFYGNRAKHYSPSVCPECNKDTFLFLKQSGQTWAIIDIAQEKVHDRKPKIKEEPKVEETPASEFVCEVCGQVCKNKSGLSSHMRRHK